MPPDLQTAMTLAASEAVGEANDNIRVVPMKPHPTGKPTPRAYVTVWQRMPRLGVSLMTAMREVW